jgi:hypothetical protein
MEKRQTRRKGKGRWKRNMCEKRRSERMKTRDMTRGGK